MKIAIDARAITDNKVGFRTYVLNLLNSLTRIDKDNTYLCYFRRNEEYFPFKGIKINKPLGSLENHMVGDFWEQMLLPIDLLREKVDVYHGTIGRLPYIKSAAYVATIHDLIPIKFSGVSSKRYALYMEKVFKLAIQRADIVITISHSAKKDIVEMFDAPEEKIKVVYEGVSSLFSPRDFDASAKEVNKLFGICDNYILTVGTLEPRKNYLSLFKAFLLLKKNGLKYKLVVVGPKAWEGDKIQRSAKELGLENEIIFIENVHINELIWLYNGARILVFPSLYEGFGLPILEAMACGTPVAASNTSSIPEVVGDAALLFDPLNVEEMADTIEKLLIDTELQQNLRNRGLERIKLFSWEKCARETLKIYKELR